MTERTNKFFLFLVISLTLRALYIFLFSKCYSFDLVSWNVVSEILMSGGNPYNLTSFLNYPPLWMQLVFLLKSFSLATHWPFNHVVRGFLIIAEIALSLVLYITITRFVTSKNAAKLLIFGIAINPISIFQVCQHCNFDVLVGFWVLLAVYMLLRFQEQHESRFWLCACFALGMGALTKIVPLSLVPLLLISIRKLKFIEQILGMALLLVPIMLATSIVYVLGPTDVQTKVFGYRAVPGGFGFSGLFNYFGMNREIDAWPHVFILIFGACWFLLGTWLFFKEALDKRQIVSMATVILVAIPAFGPGYGPQYIYWFLPLFILMYALSEGNKIRTFLLVLYGVATLTYTIEYALDFNTFGAFLLEIIQTETLLKMGLMISSKAGSTFLCLPLWILYCSFVMYFGAKIIGEINRDIKALCRQD